MTHPNPTRSLHLGMREGDLTGKPYADFWNPHMAPLPEHAKDALLHGPVAAELLPSLKDAPRLLLPGDLELENGFGFQSDGSLHVAIRTDMPLVSPAMVDWWFGWHGSEAQRYKLWHPRAHVHAQWETSDSRDLKGSQGRERYVGRVSFVDEYIGSQLSHVTITFIPPSELGLDEKALADPAQATAVCAKISFADHPVEIGYLVHHIRRVSKKGWEGSEMRSRFWMGGPYARVRAGLFLDQLVSQVARRVLAPKADTGRELLVHCSQEMSHLAAFLPRLYSALRDLP
jgi:hypothetical protein